MPANQLIELAKCREIIRMGNETKSASEDRLIIALDFGTTYSGIAYAFPARRDPSPQAIMNWPGAEGLSKPKIPTLIRYDKNDPTKFEWGALVGQHSDNIVGVKLLLDPAQPRPFYLPAKNIKKDIKGLPKPPVEVAADFIGAMYRHAMVEISKKVLKSYLDMCCTEYVLSVPAVWSDAAKNATLDAAKLAGIHEVTLVKEPEAAGLYTAKSLDMSIRRHQTFVICDAGGGTVDLVSYEIEKVLPGFEAKELVPGTGGMAGSLGLNNRFADAVATLVGDDQWFPLKKSTAFLNADEEFEVIKKRFLGRKNEKYIVNFPMAGLEYDPENGLLGNSWTMTCEDMEEIFEPLIKDILRLVKEQVDAVVRKRPAQRVTGIFLVGGFGSSLYLKDRVQKRYPDIQVLQPDDAWAAIAKGAALSRMPSEAVVTSTSATRHYGVEANFVFDKSTDDGQWTYVDRDGFRKAQRMTWYINIGDDILRKQKIKFPFYRYIGKDFGPSDLIFKDFLYKCDDEKAPIHRSKGERIRVNCTVKSDLSGVPRSRFKSKIDKDGEPYLQVDYDLVVTLQSAVMKFSLEVNGDEVGSVDASVLLYNNLNLYNIVTLSALGAAKLDCFFLAVKRWPAVDDFEMPVCPRYHGSDINVNLLETLYFLTSSVTLQIENR